MIKKILAGLAALGAAVAAVLGLSGSPDYSPKLYPQPGGIAYGFRLEGVNQDSAIRVNMQDLAVVINSEAQITSCPDLVPRIRAINPTCRIGLEISAWGGWVPPGSQYWPLRTAFGQMADAQGWWLKYSDGTPVRVADGKLGLVDLTNPKALDWYVLQVNAARSRIQPDFLFYDECHETIGFLPRAAEIVLVGHGPRPPPAGVRDSLWALAEAKLIRRTGGGIPNGTFHPRRAASAVIGIYVQNALRDFPWAKVFWMHNEYDHPLIVVESPCTTVEEQRALVGLASLVGAQYQVTTGFGWKQPMVQPYPAGSWGKATSEPDPSRRTFERAIVQRESNGTVKVFPQAEVP